MKAYNGIYNRFIKRGIGYIIAIPLLLVAIPVYIIIAIAILLEDGPPVFYRPLRGGYKGKPFRIFKFRTMVKNADKIHNLQEAVFSGPMDGKSKKACRFARMYVKKADKYYRGKFSQLLDDLIDECLKTVSPRV